MPKNVRFESVKYHFLVSLSEIGSDFGFDLEKWSKFVDCLVFEYHGAVATVLWANSGERPFPISLREFNLYSRGDGKQAHRHTDQDIESNNKLKALEIARTFVSILDTREFQK